MAPLLAGIVGNVAPIAIIGIVIAAYAIGYVMRYNILYVESYKPEGIGGKRFVEIEYLGNVVLVVAYVIAVAFYLTLMSEFLLKYLEVDNKFLERSITTVVIVFIAVVGYFFGLRGLERLESWSMTIQLSVVCALILGLIVFYLGFTGEISFTRADHSKLMQAQMLAGVLLVVQGFETSRFLGNAYSPSVRIKSMRIAQIISGIVYMGSVFLLMPALTEVDLRKIELSDIIAAMVPVAMVLPSLLMFAALMSQFSAAVADTSGGGGLLQENSRGRLTSKIGYVVVSAAAILLIWSVNLLQIIVWASKAFAAYYFIQTILALWHNHQEKPGDSKMVAFRYFLFGLIAIILGLVVVFSIPAE